MARSCQLREPPESGINAGGGCLPIARPDRGPADAAARSWLSSGVGGGSWRTWRRGFASSPGTRRAMAIRRLPMPHPRPPTCKRPARSARSLGVTRMNWSPIRWRTDRAPSAVRYPEMAARWCLPTPPPATVPRPMTSVRPALKAGLVRYARARASGWQPSVRRRCCRDRPAGDRGGGARLMSACGRRLRPGHTHVGYREYLG